LPPAKPTSPGPFRAPFSLQVFLESAGVARTLRKYPRSAIVFSQGNRAEDVFYIQQGSIKLSVLSRAGKEAVVAVLGPGDFFGEGCLAGPAAPHRHRGRAHCEPVTHREKPQMLEMLHTQTALAERFLAHTLARNIRVEEDLVDQLFNSSEKRLARVLLLLSRYGKADQPRRIPKMSQETLAKIVGTTRSRVNFFMNKFRKLGFIEYKGDIKVNSSLLTVVLHD
jgi:CRP-like cAMP-binding protein